MLTTAWEPATDILKELILATSDEVLAQPDLELDVREEVFRINVLGLDWDVGGKVYEPVDRSKLVIGADGKPAGLFVLHGGGGDHRSMEPIAMLLAGKFGFKVATMSYLGNLYLLDPSRNWPGDTINPDGTARTPIWCTDSLITPDQYELIRERSNVDDRRRWGTLHFLRAREGTEFHARMAAWPLATEEAIRAVCARSFPAPEWSVYLHGHSTGGPFVHMMLQRIENCVGLIGTETSPFGAFYSRLMKQQWRYPFNYLMVRTWRDVARYAGPEAGPDGMWRLPWLMEDVLEEWERRKHLPGIKAQYIVHFGSFDALEAAARTSAARLGMSSDETEALVQRFRSYPLPLQGEGARPLPPLLYGIAIGSRDHKIDQYRQVLLPALAETVPPPKARVLLFHAGVHGYMKPEDGLPRGIGPAVARLWHDAITKGYYLDK